MSPLAAAYAQDARSGRRRSGPAALAAVAVPWLLLPPVLLAFSSQITPIWESRYLLFCVPALALLAVAAAALLPVRAGLAALTVTLAAALAAQPIVRPAVATDDMRAVSQLLSAEARPGDAVFFAALGRRLIKAAYPAGFANLRDIGLNTSPAYRNTLYGKPVSQAVLRGRLAGVHRVWVIGYATSHPAGFFGAAALPYPFCSGGTRRLPGSAVTLYLQCRQVGHTRGDLAAVSAARPLARPPARGCYFVAGGIELAQIGGLDGPACTSAQNTREDRAHTAGFRSPPDGAVRHIQQADP